MSTCPCCFGDIVSGRCQRCGVAIGNAKPIGGKRRRPSGGSGGATRDRTIASPGAESIGRSQRSVESLDMEDAMQPRDDEEDAHPW